MVSALASAPLVRSSARPAMDRFEAVMTCPHEAFFKLVNGCFVLNQGPQLVSGHIVGHTFKVF